MIFTRYPVELRRIKKRDPLLEVVYGMDSDQMHWNFNFEHRKGI